jgi:hypothetical protein
MKKIKIISKFYTEDLEKEVNEWYRLNWTKIEDDKIMYSFSDKINIIIIEYIDNENN